MCHRMMTHHRAYLMVSEERERELLTPLGSHHPFPRAATSGHLKVTNRIKLHFPRCLTRVQHMKNKIVHAKGVGA